MNKTIFVCVYTLTEMGPVEKQGPSLIYNNVTQKIILLSKTITEVDIFYYICFYIIALNIFN